MTFDYDLDFDHIDYRKEPEKYRVGRGEHGVLLVEPYKSEILPHWRFKTPGIAKESSEKIYQMFLDYKQDGDIVGMDMARKFLQMGYTRSRRYANYKGERSMSKMGISTNGEWMKKKPSQPGFSKKNGRKLGRMKNT